MTSPVFLYGFARSGTTLLTMMTGAHPQISVPLSVTGLWYRTAEELETYNDLKTSNDVARLAEDLCAHERIKLWKTPFDPQDIAGQVRPGHYSDVISAFHKRQAEQEGKPIWANMDIATINNIEHVVNWFPNAKFIHIVRDVRDVALSHQSMAFSEGNFLEIAMSWSELVGAADRVGAALGPERHRTIRYEDLILDAETTLRKICDLFAIDYSPQMLNYAGDVKQKVPEARRGLWPALDKPPQAEKVDQWRRRLKPVQQYIVEEYAGTVLRRFGYECPKSRSFSILGELYGCGQYLGRGHRLARLRRKFGLGSAKKLGSAETVKPVRQT